MLVLAVVCWLYACYGQHCRFGGDKLNPGNWSLIGRYAVTTLGCVLLLLAFLGADPKLLPGWAIYLGRISFGHYIYNEFAIAVTDRLIIRNLAAHMNSTIKSLEGPIFLLNTGLTLGLTVLMAAVSYRYFETPLLRLKKRHSVIESQPIGDAR